MGEKKKGQGKLTTREIITSIIAAEKSGPREGEGAGEGVGLGESEGHGECEGEGQGVKLVARDNLTLETVSGPGSTSEGSGSTK